MNKEDHLFQLINALDQGEKRYVSINMLAQKGDNNDYQILYEYLLKQSDYDEDAIKEKLKLKIPKHRFAAVKNYLYSKLLSQLKDYHAEDSVDLQIRNHMQLVEILFKKGLIRQSEKQLSGAKKLAEKNYKIRQLIQIYDWEYSISTVSEVPAVREKSFERIDMEEQRTLKLLGLQFDYHRIHFRLFNHLYRFGIPQKEEDRLFFREILEEPLMQEVPDVPPYTLDLYYSILNACNYMCTDYEKAAIAGKARLEVFKNHEDFAIEESYQYAAATNNYLQNINNLEKWSEMAEIIDRAYLFAENNRKKILDVSVLLFNFVIHQFKIKMLMAQKHFEEADEWIKKHSREILELIGNKEKEKNVYILPLSIAVNSFILGKIDESLYWIRTILNDDRHSIRNDIYSFSAIFHLIVHYELGNYSILEYQNQSLQRYLSEQGRKSDFEALIPNLLIKMAEYPAGREETKKLLTSGHEKLKEIVNRTGFESSFIKQFYIVEWFESKLDNKNFFDYLCR